MGNETSSEAKSTLGLHVVGIEAGSSADRAGIQLYFDYLTHLNGQPIIKQQLNSLDDGPHDFIVYSTKSRAHRGITIVPIVGGSRLGMKLKLCDYSKSPKNVYQILDMYTVSFRNPDSPASIAGLIAHDDFVIATTMTKHKLDFQELIRDNIGKFVELYVYNTVQDSIRRVLIEPRDDWGGVGL